MAKKTQIKKRQRKEEQYIIICPKCKSPDVDMDKTNPVQPALGMPPMYICNRCKHSGYTFPEIPVSELENFEEEAKKEGLIDSGSDNTPKIDTRYGDFEVRVLWKYGAPLIIIIGIIVLFKVPVLGIIYVLLGLFMSYITYFKKRKLKDN